MGMRIWAIYEGDLSGTLVHPALIHVAHLGGFAVWQQEHSRFSCGTEEYLLRLAEDSLADLEKEQDKSRNWFLTCTYVYTAIAGYHLWCRRVDMYLEYLHRATDLVNNFDVESIIDEFLASEYPISRAETGPYAMTFSTSEGKRSPMSSERFFDSIIEIVCAIARVANFDWSTAPILGRACYLHDAIGTQLSRLKVRFTKVYS
jgi:hypothetical protein